MIRGLSWPDSSSLTGISPIDRALASPYGRLRNVKRKVQRSASSGSETRASCASGTRARCGRKGKGLWSATARWNPSAVGWERWMGARLLCTEISAFGQTVISTGGGSPENHRDFTESTISQTALEIAPLSHPVISAKSSSTRHEFTQDFSKISPTARARSPTAVHGTWPRRKFTTGERTRSTHHSGLVFGLCFLPSQLWIDLRVVRRRE